MQLSSFFISIIGHEILWHVFNFLAGTFTGLCLPMFPKTALKTLYFLQTLQNQTRHADCTAKPKLFISCCSARRSATATTPKMHHVFYKLTA